MDNSLIYIIGGSAIILVIVILSLILGRKKKQPINKAEQSYIKGLNLIIAGEPDKALEALRLSVRLDTGYIDAYVKIGDIMRKKGLADSAINVHRDLLVRPILTKEQRISINKSLAEDYKAAKNYTKSLEACERILSLEKQETWAKDFELGVYENMGDWQGAFDIVKKKNNLSKEEKNSRLACYKVEQGRYLCGARKEHEARLRFREAIKTDKNCIQAYLELSDSYMREKRASDASDALKKLLENNPKFSGLAFARLKQVLFELGNFSEIEKIYGDILKANPDVVDAYLGLAEIYEKKGEVLQAIDTCKKALTFEAERLDVKLLLVRLYSKLGRNEQSVEIASKLAMQFVQEKDNYLCEKCGYATRDYFWQCPNCTTWNSAKRDV